MAFVACPLDFLRCALSLRGLPVSGAACSFLHICDPLSFPPSSKTRSGPSGSFVLLQSPQCLAAPLRFRMSNRTSSLVVFQRSPLRRFLRIRPVPLSVLKDCPLRSDTAKCPTPSVFAVPPGSDGLLRMRPCRFIAPCTRPWGSSGFAPGLVRHRVSTIPDSSDCSSRSHSHPSKLFPCRQLLRVTALLFPLAVAVSNRFQFEPARPQGFAPSPSP